LLLVDWGWVDGEARSHVRSPGGLWNVAARREPGEATTGPRTPGESGGDEHHGYALSLQPANHIMRMRLWGSWKYELCVQFRSALLRLGRGLNRPWAILCDSRGFPAQSPKVTRLRATTMDEVADIGCVRIAAIVQTAVYSMQFQRIAGQSRLVYAVFDNEESASRWLRESSVAPA
jgi:hypothetical protein